MSAGAGTVFIYLLVYFLRKEWMLHPALYWGTLGVYLFFMVRAARMQAQQSEEPAWRKLLRPPFTVFLIANLIFWIFYFLIFTFDASLRELSQEQQLQALEQISQMMDGGLSDQQMRESREQIEEAGGGFRLSDLFFSYGKGVLGGFGLSALIALWAQRL